MTWTIYITGFASRIPSVVLRGGESKSRRRQILVDFGFEELYCEATVFLDWAVADLGEERVILDILTQIGRQHMRLAFVLEGFYAGLTPE